MKTLIICAILFLFSTASAQPFTILSLTEPVPEEHAMFGRSVSGAGDVNGDGFDDVIVGVRYGTVDGIEWAGEAFMFLGPYLISVVPLTDPAPDTHAQYGFSVSGAGDVNGDGFDDVIVGTYVGGGVNAPPGRAVVFLGPDADSAISLSEPVPESSAVFGSSVSGAGDVDGDGFDDVIVGAYSANVCGADAAGRAFAFLGPGLDSVIPLTEPVPELGATFGISVSGAGDVNGDGFDDVIVGAHSANPWGVTDAGEAFVFLGPDLDSVIPLTEPVLEEGAIFGGRVSGLGDVDGNGLDDVIVGASAADPWGIFAAGEAFVFLGPGLDSVIPLTEPVPEEVGTFGRSVSGAGDVNGDGFYDVLVGAGGTVDGLAMAGEAFLFLGPDLDSVISFSEPAPDSGAGFSSSLSGAGDVDGDSLSDLVVGACLGDVGGIETAGEAFVFLTREVGIQEQSPTFNVQCLEVQLLQNEPNPFGGRTVIGYSLPAAGAVALEIYDITGRLAKILVDEHQKPGLYQVRWEPKDNSSGIYFYRLQAGSFADTKKMMHVRK